MLRFLIVVAALFGVVYAFQTLQDQSGEVSVTLGGSVYAMDLTNAAIAAILVLIALLLVFAIVRGLVSAPGRARRRWRDRREAQARGALSRGFLAIAAGDARAAERAVAEAERRDADRPLTLLLEAQTAQLRGDRAAARRVFEEMAREPETRIAGLRGLHVEAEREGDPRSARLIAEQATEGDRPAPWAARALLRHQTAEGDWDSALKMLSLAADGRIIDKRTARRDRAVILAAQALALEDGEPDRARAAALEAHDLAPDLVPAAVVAGRLLARTGDIRRATKVLETTWKEIQHPEIAEAYAHVRPGDAALDRMKRADTLHRLRPQADAGRLALARAALDAREFGEARKALMPVITTRPTRNSLILLAEIEEAETGDRGRAREWLARAVRAPRDAAWTADGIVLAAWAPVSPVSGRLDAVEWKVPVEEIAGPALEIDEAEMRPEPAPEPKLIGGSSASPRAQPAAPVTPATVDAVPEAPAPAPAASQPAAAAGSGATAHLAPADATAPALAGSVTPMAAEASTPFVAAAKPGSGAVHAAADPAADGAADLAPAGGATSTVEPVAAAAAPGGSPAPEPAAAKVDVATEAPPRLPDDPGVIPDDEDPQTRLRRYS